MRENGYYWCFEKTFGWEIYFWHDNQWRHSNDGSEISDYCQIVKVFPLKLNPPTNEQGNLNTN